MCSTVHTPRHQSQTTHLISEPFRHVSSMFTHDVLRATHSCSTYYISTEATEPQRAHELTRTPVRAHARAKTILRVLLCSCQLQPSPPSRPAHAIARPTFSRSPRSRSADALTLPTLALPMLATPQRSLRLRSLRLRLLHPLSTVKLGAIEDIQGARPAGSLKAPRAQLTPAKWGWVHMRRIVGMSVSRPANQQHHSSMLAHNTCTATQSHSMLSRRGKHTTSKCRASRMSSSYAFVRWVDVGAHPNDLDKSVPWTMPMRMPQAGASKTQN